MTTNIYDCREKIIACDSRWSTDSEEYIIYSDDTGYKKIICFNGVFIVFAGYKREIDKLIRWVTSGMETHNEPIITSGLSYSLIYDGKIYNYSNLVFYLDKEGQKIASFAGSGSKFAFPKWDTNFLIHLSCQCLITSSLKFAADNDIYTGGELKTIKLNEVNHHDHRHINIPDEDFHRVFIETGYIYMKKYGTTVKYTEAKSDVRNDVERMLGARQADIAAPFPGMDKIYTREESKKITSDIKDFFVKNELI